MVNMEGLQTGREKCGACGERVRRYRLNPRFARTDRRAIKFYPYIDFRQSSRCIAQVSSKPDGTSSSFVEIEKCLGLDRSFKPLLSNQRLSLNKLSIRVHMLISTIIP